MNERRRPPRRGRGPRPTPAVTDPAGGMEDNPYREGPIEPAAPVSTESRVPTAAPTAETPPPLPAQSIEEIIAWRLGELKNNSRL